MTIFGLGYIGLPTAALFANIGLNVIGVARNKKRLEIIKRGQSPIKEPGLEDLINKAVKNKKLSVTTDGLEACKKSNVMIIIVPTPTNDDLTADLTAVIDTSNVISKALKKDDLVIVESTIPQGTCENIIIPILEKSGLTAGDDFGVVYTPERAIPNNTIYEMTHNARVMGGVDEESTDLAISLYEGITKGEIIKVKNLVTAETVKLIENTYRDTNIALANEIALVCEKLGVDAIEAINAANHHPRVNIHTPGPGVGGHCLAIDPYFIVETAEEKGIDAKLIKNARAVNERMPAHVVQIIDETLYDAGKKVEDSKIGLLGVAYKGNVPDSRETPARPIINILNKKGAYVKAHDPYTTDKDIKSFGATPVSMDEALSCDIVVLITDHDDYKEIKPHMIKNNLFICTRPIIDPEEFKNNGIIFKGIGRII